MPTKAWPRVVLSKVAIVGAYNGLTKHRIGYEWSSDATLVVVVVVAAVVVTVMVECSSSVCSLRLRWQIDYE